MTKNDDIDKYKHYGYGLEFDRKGYFSDPSSGIGRNCIIFRVDMSSSTKTDISKKYIIFIGKGPTQGLEHTLSTEKCIYLILLEIIKKFVWACIMMEPIVIYLLMVKKLINLKQKIQRLQQLYYV